MKKSKNNSYMHSDKIINNYKNNEEFSELFESSDDCVVLDAYDSMAPFKEGMTYEDCTITSYESTKQIGKRGIWIKLSFVVKIKVSEGIFKELSFDCSNTLKFGDKYYDLVKATLGYIPRNKKINPKDIIGKGLTVKVKSATLGGYEFPIIQNIVY
ncbi:hypothetical protein C1H57_08170 [Clostridium sp. 2-1]|uniref:hypothetical protein n=1 Tax=Clostridium TaxID=1485 RepID=UPI00040908CE|nr:MULTISPECIES: hypothetical protein [Clostridium]MBN7575382.1 hypothetical protein [Clostridium beijerinckii]MBN7580693.1 hypothetical protein [Clostridium beijerinckii]MBN7585146.1 hypothetical protein [Clostridium beijerinckii]MBO0522524.1 hypothetical protein [Clostridium beijerinckii]POO91788.1 hypothetical protein C1H57_08170 [Clostridium sp. 2-1]